MPGRSLREGLAKAAVKALNWLSRLTARGSGTVIGGRVGLAIAPDLLTSLARGREIVLVSGTNGKTTTTAFVATGWGREVATNDTGSNMPPGHVAALVARPAVPAALEVDESWLPAVASAVLPRVIVLLNLSRDQLDRANEVRKIAQRWRDLLAGLENVTVVANANDPLVVFAAQAADSVAWCDVPTPWIFDAQSCPLCTEPLRFEASGWASSCGFRRPEDVATTLGSALVVRGEELDLALALPGEFNRSNAAMALTALSYVGVDVAEAVKAVNGLSDVAGRFSLRHWRGRSLRLMLAKNPAGFSALLRTVPDDGRALVVAINARVADGRDPSWLYDVPFELLRGHRVYCFGERRLDLATRLEYAEVDFVVADDEVELPSRDGVIDVLANYTAFQDWLARTTA